LEGVGRFKKIKQKIFKDSQPDRLQMGSRWAPGPDEFPPCRYFKFLSVPVRTSLEERTVFG
jgi:hypothetical protein